jgi:protein SCO1/2
MTHHARTLASRIATGMAAALLCAALRAAPAPAAEALPRDSVYQLSLRLTDQDGRTTDWRARRGAPQLVSMFYTSCPYMCPLIVDANKAVEHALSPAQQKRIGILLISMDPAHDDPAALKALAAKRGLDTRRWTLASPPAADVRAVAGVLGVRYRALADGGFNHTSVLLLLDGEGRIVARTERVGGVVDPDFLAAVRKVVGP